MRFSVFGDSISTFSGVTVPENAVYYDAVDTNGCGITSPEQTWWMRVIRALGGSLLANASYSGSMVAGRGFPAGCSKERAQQILGPGGEMPDVVLIFIGINDFGWGGAEAQLYGHSAAAPHGADLASYPLQAPGAAPASALEEFAKAYGRMLKNMWTVSPASELWCMTLLPGRIKGASEPAFCYQLRGIDLADYNDAVRQAAREEGCRLLDIEGCGFDYQATDGTHPDQVGMAQIAEMVLACKEDRMAKIPDEMASKRLCTKPLCVGCPFAKGTGNPWYCVCEKPWRADVAQQ